MGLHCLQVMIPRWLWLKQSWVLVLYQQITVCKFLFIMWMKLLLKLKPLIVLVQQEVHWPIYYNLLTHFSHWSIQILTYNSFKSLLIRLNLEQVQCLNTMALFKELMARLSKNDSFRSLFINVKIKIALSVSLLIKLQEMEFAQNVPKITHWVTTHALSHKFKRQKLKIQNKTFKLLRRFKKDYWYLVPQFLL